MTASIRSRFRPPLRPRASAKKFSRASRRHVGIERAVFRQIAQPGGAGQAVGRHVMAGDKGLSGGRRQVAGEELHRRALAGAVGAEKGDDLALIHAETDILDGRKAAVILREPLGFDHRGG